MKTSSFIVMAGATLVAASTIGTGLVRAFPAVPAPPAATEKAPYVWRGYWDARVAVPAGDLRDCPQRKVWTETPEGPRLKWRRTCLRDG